jgi:hypothetical protein
VFLDRMKCGRADWRLFVAESTYLLGPSDVARAGCYTAHQVPIRRLSGARNVVGSDRNVDFSLEACVGAVNHKAMRPVWLRGDEQ